ncbi:lipoprotein UxpA, partial [Pseudomonas mosselii]|nr:lipoprotein UxpA [Pseudomonas mosselii]
MASSVGRREVIGWMGVGALAPLLGACSALPGPRGGSDRALDLLYVADTLDARQPGQAVVPATRLGPVSHLGRAPWMSGPNASAGQPELAPLLDAGFAGQARTGGYAVLAALLEQLRAEAGSEQCLTLENGQCWNGSGLAYLTQGESGVQGSQLLGSEARVSSDERVLWPQRSAGLYRQSSSITLGAGLADTQAKALGVEGVKVFQRAGVRIAVVGVTDPYAQDQKASLKQWYQSLQPSFQQARREADLVVALADVGTGPGLWLAERVPEVDVLLCARGQDLWPAPVLASQASGRRVPVLFAGCRASGAFRLRCRQAGGQWQFE